MSSSSSSEFSSDEEDEQQFLAATAAAHAAGPLVHVVSEEREVTGQPCCVDAVQTAQTYDQFMAALAHLAEHWPAESEDNAVAQQEDQAASYRALRAHLYGRFQRAFPLTAEMYAQWIDDTPSVSEQKKLYERAMGDYWSVPLTCGYLQFLHGKAASFSCGWLRAWLTCRDADNDGEANITADTVKTAIDQALDTTGLHYAQGHEVWKLCRDILGERADDVDATGVSKEKTIRSLFSKQMFLPLQQNDLDMSEFRAWNSYNTLDLDTTQREAVIATAHKRQTLLSSLYKKMNSYEDRLVAVSSDPAAQETPEQIWLQYLNLVHFRLLSAIQEEELRPRIMTSFYERAIAMVCLSTAIWTKYVAFVAENDEDSNAKLALCERAVRNVSFDSGMWNELLLEMERSHCSVQEITVMVEEKLLERPVEALVMDQYHYLSVLLTYCDVYRRHACAQESGADRSLAFKHMHDVFTVCIAFMDTHFASFPLGVTQIMEYQAKCWMLPEDESARDRKLLHWEQLWIAILQKRSHEAEAWIAYYQECLRVGIYDRDSIRSRVFEAAIKVVIDYPVSIADLWLRFERENGDLKRFLHVRQLHATLSAKAAQAVAIEAAASTPTDESIKDPSRKRKANDKPAKSQQKEPKRAKTTAKNELNAKNQSQASIKPTPVTPSVGATDEKKLAHERLTNEHTVFVCNIPKEATKEELQAVFQDIPTLRDVRLVVKTRGNHIKSRGMAYVQFTDEPGVEAALAHNKQHFQGLCLSVERSKPPTAKAESAAPSSQNEKRDGSWKTNPFTVYVGGLHAKGADTTTEDRLKQTMEQVLSEQANDDSSPSKVKKVSILIGKHGKPKDYGLVEFTEAEATTKCFTLLDELKKLLGDQVTLKPSRFSIDEILAQQQRQSSFKGPKQSAAAKSTSKKTPRDGPDTTPHAKPSNRLAIGSMSSSKMLMPRALRKKPTSSSSTTETPTDADSKPKTNDDFRKLLLQQK